MSESIGSQAGLHGGRFIGWRMVGVGFLSNFLASGVTLAAFGNFVDPVSESFGVTRSTTSQGMAIVFVVTGLMGPLAGALLDRGWARPMMATGSLLAGVGLILLSRATELWQAAVLFCGVVGLGASLFGFLPAMALVSHWFVRQRGLAIGISAAGLTIAAGLAPAGAEFLIGQYGWRSAMMALGVFTILIGFPTFAGFVVGRPERVGQWPDGDSAPVDEVAEGTQSADSEAQTRVLETRELVADRRLWLLSLGFGLILASPLVLTPIVVPYGTDLGLSELQASAFFLAMMPFSLLGKVVLGKWADMAPIKPAMAVVVLGNAVVWLILTIDPGYTLFLLTGAIYGLGIGGVAPLQGVTIGRCFGRENFGRAAGLGGLLSIVIIASAMVAFQTLYASTGSYQLGFLVQTALIFIGGALIFVVKIPKPIGDTA
ncbi:MAG: MFS transporter [Myxococcales bacterium]|nr:MFS transporter [Myxococcales bacterium]HIK84318.1 MFS transporter [Myxococcales bacterium]